jgi:IS1 family transposase
LGLHKKKQSQTEEDIEKEYGRSWIWTAIDTPTRLLLHFVIADRTLKSATTFLKEIKNRLAEGKPLFISDELPHYAKALSETFSETIQPPQTGEPKEPQRVVDDDLDYATVHKTRKDGRVVKVERNVVMGEEDRVVARLGSSPSKTINTAYVERSNLTFRMLDAHLTRKTLWFAKSMRWLQARFSVIVATYNFVRPHTSLGSAKQPVTPGMAAGITKNPWTIGYLLGLPMIC